MGINVQLRRESGEIVDQVGDPKMVLSRAAHKKLSGTRLLRYVVPWGDAIFNQAQAADLSNDVADVKRENPDTPLVQLLSDIEPLVERLARETHLYLWFVGD
jgi:hypothetical protein